MARSVIALTCVALLVATPGCSLMLMASKVLVGEPKVKSAFTSRTGIDLVKDEKSCLIVCSTPEFLRSEYSAVDRDIIDGVFRLFRRQHIDCVNPNKVDSWLSRIGGVWDEPSEITAEFDAQYIIHFEVESISYQEENSAGLYRGNAYGHVSVYESRPVGDTREAFLIFQHEFRSTYPNHYPMSADNMSKRAFSEKYNARVAEELARLFYDYRPSETVY